MAPWGHMYVNPGLTEPFIIVRVESLQFFVKGFINQLERIGALWTKQNSAFIMRAALFDPFDLAFSPRLVIDECEPRVKRFSLSAFS